MSLATPRQTRRLTRERVDSYVRTMRLVMTREMVLRRRSVAFWASLGLMVLVVVAGGLASLASLGRQPGEVGDPVILASAGFVVLLVLVTTLGFVLADSVCADRESGYLESLLPFLSGCRLVAAKMAAHWVLTCLQLLALLVVAVGTLAATGQAGWITEGRTPVALAWGIGLALSTLGLVAGMVARLTLLLRRVNPSEVGGLLSALSVVVPLGIGAFARPTGRLGDVLALAPGLSVVAVPTRLLRGASPWWEAPLALVLVVTAGVVVARRNAGLLERSVWPEGGAAARRRLSRRGRAPAGGI